MLITSSIIKFISSQISSFKICPMYSSLENDIPKYRFILLSTEYFSIYIALSQYSLIKNASD